MDGVSAMIYENKLDLIKHLNEKMKEFLKEHEVKKDD